MSVAEKNLTDRITYDDLYRRWEQSNWSATAIDFSADRDGWAGLSEMQRRSAVWIYSMFFFGEDSRRRQPLPLHRRGPEGGAEVLPRDPAGRRGPPRDLLPPLLQGGDRGRRHDRRHPRLHRAAPRLGLPQVFDRLERDGRGAAQRPLAAEVRAGDHALPPGRRGHRWRSPASTSSRTSSSRRARCPASVEGMENVSRDEQRHIGFGVKVLERAARASRDECKAAIDELLARGDAVRLRRSSSRRTGTASTRAATASSSRTSPSGACARSSRSGARSATRWRRCPPGVFPRRPRRCRRGGRAEQIDPPDPGRRRRRAAAALGRRVLARDPGALLRLRRPLGRHERRRTGRRSPSSGSSRTPSPGTSSSTTARPAPNAASTPPPT